MSAARFRSLRDGFLSFADGVFFKYSIKYGAICWCNKTIDILHKVTPKKIIEISPVHTCTNINLYLLAILCIHDSFYTYCFLCLYRHFIGVNPTAIRVRVRVTCRVRVRVRVRVKVRVRVRQQNPLSQGDS